MVDICLIFGKIEEIYQSFFRTTEELPVLPVSLVQSACDIIETARPMLVDAILADLCQNIIWNARCEESGFAYSHADAHHQLDFLTAAIRSADTERYASYWVDYRLEILQRGACTHHVHRLIDSTACAVALTLRDGFLLAEPCFSAAHRALAYAQPACQALNRNGDAILEGTLARWLPAEGGATPALHDLRYHLSYLEDALALDRPALFRQHLAWLERSPAEYGFHPARLDDNLRVLGEEIRRFLPPEFAAGFIALLAR
jgi:hypothetical protein